MRVIQITDTHLFSDKSAELQGFNTHDGLSKTIDHLLKQGVHRSDIVLLTGDISQDESSESYHLALVQLMRIKLPIYWIHGNHDQKTNLTLEFSKSAITHNLYKLSTTYWDFISINTVRYGTDSGHIEEAEILRVLQAIAVSKKDGKNIAMVMHHHPVKVGTPLVDNCMLQENHLLLEILNKNKEIKLVICGHAHGDYQVKHNEYMIEVCPATCFQWKKGTSSLEKEDKRGFKIFNMYSSDYSSFTFFA